MLAATFWSRCETFLRLATSGAASCSARSAGPVHCAATHSGKGPLLPPRSAGANQPVWRAGRAEATPAWTSAQLVRNRFHESTCSGRIRSASRFNSVGMWNVEASAWAWKASRVPIPGITGGPSERSDGTQHRMVELECGSAPMRRAGALGTHRPAAPGTRPPRVRRSRRLRAAAPPRERWLGSASARVSRCACSCTRHSTPRSIQSTATVPWVSAAVPWAPAPSLRQRRLHGRVGIFSKVVLAQRSQRWSHQRDNL